MALKGDDDKAIADYSRAVCFDPCDAEAFFNRSQIWARQGELEKAVKDLKIAVGLNPTFLNVFDE